MKTSIPGVDWLLDCEPRPAQVEALARSFRGEIWRNGKDQPFPAEPEALPHRGRPAKGWCHFMQMRLGKTPTLLNEHLLFERDYGVNRLLVIAPSRYKEDWGLEAERFGVTTPLHIFESKRRAQAAAFVSQTKGKPAMLVVHYEGLISDDTMKVLSEFVDDRTLIAADESVLIKNNRSIFFKHALQLSKGAAAARALTGKPVVQGPHDLWSQLRFAKHLEGFNFYQFRNSFCQMGGFRGKKVVGEKNSERLQEILSRCSFQARRSDWGTNFDPDYETRKVGMTPEQRKLYRDMEEDFVIWLDSGDAITTEQVITKHMKLQQISSGFIIDEEGKAQPLMPVSKIPKLVEVRRALEEEVSGKALVICHYSYSVDALMEALAEFKPAVIQGEAHMRRRGVTATEEKRRFNEDPECRVLIGQERSVKYGHTLMGSKDDPCQTTFYYENTYSLDDRAQTEERNQGEGQTAGIHIIDLVSSPVEREVVRALQRKEDVSARVMGYYKGEEALPA